MKYAVVVVGYNRAKSMKKLLDSLCNARYESPCDLIISLDYSDKQQELVEIGKRVEWFHGEKRIRTFKEKQKLRKHILQCGDLTSEYDAVIVLEDDLVVAENFFQFASEAVEFYNNDDKIAGISLYTHRTNPENGRPFEAQFNGYDVFLMQYAMSWGQCWTRDQWTKFRKWYDKQDGIADDGIIPSYVVKWNDQSWLKYYIRYTAEKDLFHVYPYFSLTTNASEVGEHNNERSSAYQVPLVYGNVKGYRFPDIDHAIKYDSYFERMFDDSVFQSYGKTMIDLYGLKKKFGDADVLISTQILDYKMIKEIELQYRPHEVNCIMQESGKGIYVYDLRCHEKHKKEDNTLKIARYDLKAQSSRMTLKHGFHGIYLKMQNIIRMCTVKTLRKRSDKS